MYKSLNAAMVNIRLGFDALLKLAAKYGFGAVECDPLWAAREGGVFAAQDLMGQNGVILSSFPLPVTFQGTAGEFAAGFACLEQAARTASALGIRRCGTYVLSWSETLDFAENFLLHTRRLRLCAEVLREYGISLALEFLGPQTLYKGRPYPFIHGMGEMLELCDAIGTENVGIMLDSYHCHCAGMRPDDFLKHARGEADIVIVHINDAPAGTPIESLPDTKRLLAGEGGGIDTGLFLRALLDLGYTGPVLSEPFSEKLNAMSSADKIAELVADSFAAVWPK